MLSQILHIPGFTVSHIEISDAELHIDLEHDSESCPCPQCGHTSHAVRHRYWRGMRDLPMSGYVCYVYVLKRYFDCPTCQKTFAEPLGFVEPNREYTTRYEEYIFQQVRHTTASSVAAREGLTDTVVTRIFLRQAKKLIPDTPFNGVKR